MVSSAGAGSASDEGGRVVGFHARDERDAERLGLGAAGAVVGLLAAQVGLDARIVEHPEGDAAGDDFRVEPPALRVEQRHGGMKIGGLAAQQAQLAHGVLVAAGLVQPLASEGGDLVRADDERVGEPFLQ
jgi:hypothetical protein